MILFKDLKLQYYRGNYDIYHATREEVSRQLLAVTNVVLCGVVLCGLVSLISESPHAMEIVMLNILFTRNR